MTPVQRSRAQRDIRGLIDDYNLMTSGVKRKLAASRDALIAQISSKVFVQFQEIAEEKKLAKLRETIHSVRSSALARRSFTGDTGSSRAGMRSPSLRPRSHSLFEQTLGAPVTLVTPDRDSPPDPESVVTAKNFLVDFRRYSVACCEDYHFKQLRRRSFIGDQRVFAKIRRVIDRNLGRIDRALEDIWEHETTPHLAEPTRFGQDLLGIVDNLLDLAVLPAANPLADAGAQSACLPNGPESVPCVEVLERQMRIFMAEWGANDFYRDFMVNKLYKALNKRRPDSLSLINVNDFRLETDIFRMSNLRVAKLRAREVVLEFDCVFRGELRLGLDFSFLLETAFLRRELAIDLVVPIRELVSVIRLKYRPREAGKSWFCFMGVPQMKYELRPKINDIDFELNLHLFNVGDIIVKHGLKNFIYPQWSSVGIPMTKKRKAFTPGS